MAEKPWHDADTLQKLYVDKKLSTTDVADKLGCSTKTVNRWLKKHDIPVRDRSEAVTNGYLSEEAKDVLCDEEALSEWYYDREMSLTEIGDELDVSLGTVRNWMDKHNLERRTISESRKGQWLSEEAKDVLFDGDALRTLYIGEELTLNAIARQLDTSQATVKKYCQQHGIQLRDWETSNQLGTNSGEDHWRWSGGHEKYYGPNWYEQREKRLDHDGYECVVCSTSNEEHKDETGFALHVHHIQKLGSFECSDGSIDYESANKLDNLVTMCQNCHRKWEGIPLRPDGE